MRRFGGGLRSLLAAALLLGGVLTEISCRTPALAATPPRAEAAIADAIIPLLTDPVAAEVARTALDPERDFESTYTCPVATGAVILQGVDGAFSHNDAFNRYAWDYEVPVGTPVVAARSGVVVVSEQHSSIGGPARRWAFDSNVIRIRHTDGLESLYLHLNRDPKTAYVGEYVARGEVIGFVGMTGWTDRPHLHFSVQENQVAVPVRFADFALRNGVPQASDRQLAPAPPWPNAAVVERLKAGYRLARRAEAFGFPAEGHAEVESTLRAVDDTDSFYAKVLRAYADRFAAAAKDQGPTLHGVGAARLAVIRGEDVAALLAYAATLRSLDRLDPRRAALTAEAERFGASLVSRYAERVRRLADEVRRAEGDAVVRVRDEVRKVDQALAEAAESAGDELPAAQASLTQLRRDLRAKAESSDEAGARREARDASLALVFVA